jgi:hypothetical protein
MLPRMVLQLLTFGYSLAVSPAGPWPTGLLALPGNLANRERSG